ncbi:MAG: hypothetical protein KDC24_02425 [Saprospiraceae bacterium]|nr:hypothetical protein [Saprospiraceae bacterium]
MKKALIGTIVGGFIIFIWQFISWGAINFHASEQQYTENQDIILECLSENLEPGDYFLPTVPPGSGEAEMEALVNEATGQPWALVSYRASFDTDMGTNLIRGLVIDLLAVYLLIWIFLKIPSPGFSAIFLSSLCVGFIGYLTIPYLNTIWFEGPSIPYLIDAVGQWGLVGAWLGWWLNR